MAKATRITRGTFTCAVCGEDLETVGKRGTVGKRQIPKGAFVEMWNESGEMRQSLLIDMPIGCFP